MKIVLGSFSLVGLQTVYRLQSRVLYCVATHQQQPHKSPHGASLWSVWLGQSIVCTCSMLRAAAVGQFL